VEEKAAAVTGCPGADLDGLVAGEDEVDPGMADGESFHSGDEASRRPSTSPTGPVKKRGPVTLGRKKCIG
jgi:hypothetical protein